MDDFSAEAFGAFGADDCALGSPAAFLPTESFRPGWISDGSAPTASRLSA